MNKPKYRKCPKCGKKMALRKSHSKGTKFWGCMHFRDEGCDGTAPYHGAGARAGLDLDIREIENGYIITPTRKYCDNIEDEESPETYCSDRESLRKLLEELLQEQVQVLLDQIETSTEFEDEIDQKTVEEVKIKVKKRGTKDVGELLKKLAQAKARAEAGHRVED